jgi:hypothetical protein
MAEKMQTTTEKALKAILAAEKSRQSFALIKALLGQQNSPLTQIDVQSNPNDPLSPHITLTTQDEI